MRVLKWLGIVLGAVVVLAASAFLYFKSAAQAKLDKTYEVSVEPIPIPYPLTESEVAALGAAEGVDHQAIATQRALERGKHYMESRAACLECHGEDFGGKAVVDSPVMGTWIAPNITAKGKTKDYKPVDWVRLIRHCIKPDGRPATMPCQDFTWFSDQEIADIVAYIKSRPAVDRQMPESTLGPVFSMLIATDQIKLGPAVLDHTSPRPKLPPSIAPTVELGKHLGATCMGCHGMDFTGGPIVGGDPKWPPAKNLTFHETALATWTLDDFKKSLREGVRPDGTKIDPVMPVQFTSKLQDAEIEALYKYLQTVEKKPTKPQ